MKKLPPFLIMLAYCVTLTGCSSNSSGVQTMKVGSADYDFPSQYIDEGVAEAFADFSEAIGVESSRSHISLKLPLHALLKGTGNTEASGDVLVGIQPLTNSESERIHRDQRYKSLWSKTGVYWGSRIVKELIPGQLYAAYPNEQSSSFELLSKYPDEGVSMPGDPTSFWLAMCDTTKLEKGGEISTCLGTVIEGDILARFTFSGVYSRSILEIRRGLVDRLREWRKTPI